jgi:hypothetical protein
MAAGVPTTGIGGLYYLLLALAIGFCKLVMKIRSVFQTNLSRNASCVLLRFPTIAFLLSVGLILYMNVTGFRVTVPGSQPLAIPTNLWTYLGLMGGVAIMFFLFVLVMFHVRANGHAFSLKRIVVWRVKFVVPVVAIGAGVLLYLTNERLFKFPFVTFLPFDPLQSTLLVIIHVAMILSSLKLADII